MSILKPVNYAGPWIPFRSPAPCPADDILADPQVSISFNETWIPVVFSALKALTRPETYEGTLADINRVTADSHNLFDTKSGSTMPIGSIIATVLGVLPANWLLCDGATHNRDDFPILYAGLDAAFIVDADHFTVPDLRGRTVIGVGTGAGLTARAMNASGGEENHTLTSGELAAHSHPENAGWGVNQQAWWTNGGNPGSNPTVGQVTSNRNGTRVTTDNNTGAGGAHNNMQPWRALKYAIVAK